MEEILLLNKIFFPIVDTCLSCEDIAGQSFGMVPRWRLFGDFCVLYFSEPRAVRFRPVLQIYTKATPCVIQSPTAEIRRRKKKKERKKKPQDENIYGLPYYIGRP